MLNKITNETLQNFFEETTHLTTEQIVRDYGKATIILEDCNRSHFVSFEVTDKSCKAYPYERLGNMLELWKKFLKQQAEIQKQAYYATKATIMPATVLAD